VNVELGSHCHGSGNSAIKQDRFEEPKSTFAYEFNFFIFSNTRAKVDRLKCPFILLGRFHW
jgi:hypothetical protein